MLRNMREDAARQKRWAYVTQSHDLPGGTHIPGVEERYLKGARRQCYTPQYVRIATEMMLENLLNFTPDIAKAAGMSVEGLRAHAFKMVTEGKEVEKPFAQALCEAMTTANVATFAKFSIGLFTALMPELFMQSLVAIQPSEVPSPKAFALRRKYGTTVVGGATVGDRLDDPSEHDTWYGGSPRFEAVGTGDGFTTNFDLDRAGTKNHKVYVAGVLQTLTTDYVIGVGAGGGGVDRIEFTGAPAGAAAITCIYDNYAESGVANQIDVSIEEITTYAAVIALRAAWTVLSDRSAMAYHGVSLFELITPALIDEIYAEIDSYILHFLLRNATGGNTNFDTTGYLVGDATTTNRLDYEKKLIDALNTQAQAQYDLTGVRPNYVVAGSNVTLRLLNLARDHWLNFIPAADPNALIQMQHRVYLGNIAGQFDLWQSRTVNDNTALLGWQGPDPVRAACVFMPFLPIHDTGVIQDPSINFNQHRGMLSQNSICMVNDGKEFGTITLV